MKRLLLALATAVTFCAAAPALSGAQTHTSSDFDMLRQMRGQGVDINTLLQQYNQQPGVPAGNQAKEVEPIQEETPPLLETEEARDLYRTYAEELLADGGSLTESRKKKLAEKAEELDLDPREAEEIAAEIAAQRRLLVLQLLPQTQALAEEGKLEEDDRRFLEMRARDLGLRNW